MIIENIILSFRVIRFVLFPLLNFFFVILSFQKFQKIFILFYHFIISVLSFQKTFNKLYYCKWTAIKECLSDDDRSASRSSSNGCCRILSSGNTENVETIGRPDELIEFVNSVPILYNYDDDITVRFEL